ncbi:MAG: serine/threonine protein kinase, partial [Deltaproteobacteria bacterium]|nr:serine/threonine protein kinase [Deltaproteobacteria bacterium]
MSAASSGFPQLDKYELLEEIGHGGMATVYRARDIRLGREVAVKLIHKHLRENPEVRRRFVSEARAVAKLRHRGIVEVYDVSDEDDVERFLVVELVRGTTLREVLREREVLPPEVAASITVRLCEAVEHAHDCNVIHRDIKPENVLIELGTADHGRADSGPVAADSGSGPSSEGGDPQRGVRSDGATRSGTSGGPRIKLTDFGIAKTLDTKGVTSTGQILGSPAHMAPEQIEGREVGPHTDVFALGVLLYEAMVGHLPFEGKNPAQVLRHVLDGTYEPADTEQPRVGGRWAAIAARALEREPDDRIGTAAGLAELLEAELAELEMGDPGAQIHDYFADPDEYEQAHE